MIQQCPDDRHLRIMAADRKVQLCVLLGLASVLVIQPEVQLLNCVAQEERPQQHATSHLQVRANVSSGPAKKCQYLRSEWSSCNANGRCAIS